MACGFTSSKFDARFLGELLQAVEVVEIDAHSQSPQRDRAVHGSGIDIGETEALRDGTRDGAFAGARRPVNGNNQSFLCFGGDTSQYPTRLVLGR